VPDGVDLADAALVEPTAVAYRAVQRLAPPLRKSVLVVGGGTQGFLAAMILASQRDSDVAVLDNRVDRMERLRLFGVRAPAPDETFGYVLEAAGGPGSLDAARMRMTPGARLVVVGLSGQPTVEVAVDDLVVKDQTMIGSIGSPGVWPEVIAMIASGAVRPSVVVTHVLDLAEVVAAQALVRRRDPAVGKVLIAPNDD
jgi:threonine dehydrogenase-like Zn-dependent dehydrogenase